MIDSQEKNTMKTRSKSLASNSDEDIEKLVNESNKKGKKRSMTVSTHNSDVDLSKRISRSELKKSNNNFEKF